jgi:hypothetical protein
MEFDLLMLRDLFSGSLKRIFIGMKLEPYIILY